MVERNASPNTVEAYLSDIRQFAAFLADRAVTGWRTVPRSIVRAYIAELSARGVEPSSIGRKLSSIRAFYEHVARRDGDGLPNPLRNLRAPRHTDRLPVFLTEPEMVHLLALPDLTMPEGLRDRAILEVLYGAGIRASEAAGLNVDSVEWKARQLRVLGKGGRQRLALLGEPALDALRRYVEQARPRLLVGGGHQPEHREPALLLNAWGTRLTRQAINTIVKRYTKEAEVQKPVTAHKLRHTFATHLLDHQAGLREVQELLGHKRVTTTEIYTHVSREVLRDQYLINHPRA